MIQITIKKQNIITNQASFKTQELADAWLFEHEEMKSFGNAAYSFEQIVTESVPAVYETQSVLIVPSEEVLDENGLSFDPPVFTEAMFEDQEVLVSEMVPATFETIQVASEYEVEQQDLTAEIALEKAKQDKIQAGKAAREICQQVLDLIAGDNLDKVLTIEQITEMQTVFGPIQSALMTSRPSLSKVLIESVEPSAIVSAELKADCLAILANY
jgi:hypothetical protein